MSVTYSHIEQRYIDLDIEEAVPVGDDWIAYSNDEGLLEAFNENKLSFPEMIDLGFTKEDLSNYKNVY